MKKRSVLIGTLTLSIFLTGCDGGGNTGSNAPRIILNDTGVDWCADKHKQNLDCPIEDFPAQDAQFGRDKLAKQGRLRKRGGGHAGFDFTRLDKHGHPVRKNATEWACVRDNHTGLEWEVKRTDGGLQHYKNSYSWYNPDPSRNGGNPGLQNGGDCNGSRCDTEGYVSAINEKGLCGHKDWRMPEVFELLSLVDYGRIMPAIDTDYFPNTPTKDHPMGGRFTPFWSATPKAGHDDSAVYIDFNDGELFMRIKADSPAYIRLVRSTRFQEGKETAK